MARILFIIIGFNKPSSQKRVLDSLDFIKGRGHAVETVEAPSGLFGRLGLIGRLRGYDLVFIQKKLFRTLELSIMRRANRNLVFDFDDAVMFHEVERGEPVMGDFFTRFAQTARSCRGVIAGNEYLAGFAREAGAEVTVLPTPVDTDAVRPREYSAGDSVVIGWMGTKGNLSHLKDIEGALRRVLEMSPGAALKVVSDARPDMPGIRYEYKKWSREDEADDLRGFDIGVMPLRDNIWTRGKGGYKLLQYMAAGVPSVASPVGINCEIINDGVNGFLARDSRQWEETLTRLVGEPGLREAAGKAGRDTVEKDYSLKEYNRRLAGFLEGFL